MRQENSSLYEDTFFFFKLSAPGKSRLYSSTSPQIRSPVLWTVGWPVWVALLFIPQRHSRVLSFIKKIIIFLIRRKEEGRRNLTYERANPVENSFC